MKPIHTKAFTVFIITSCYGASLSAQETRSDEAVVRLIADRVVASTHFEVEPLSAYNDWRYWNGVLNIAMLRLGSALHDSKYSGFAARNVAFAFASAPYFREHYKGEDKWSYPLGERLVMKELDDYGAMSASVLDVNATSPDPAYRAYTDSAAAYLANEQGRLDGGTLVRSFPRKWTLWADDLFMAVPFLARIGNFDDAARQVINYHKYLFNDSVGLMVHNWYSDTQKPGSAYWGRANGWALAAQVELLELLPKDHPQRITLLKLLNKHIAGIVRYQSDDGLWHQLLDRRDSYEETSASAMFVYAIAHAARRGWIDKHYMWVAEKGWNGIKTRVHADGQIEGICTGTVVSDKLEDYYNRPTPLNDVHGVATVLLAGAEILKR